MKNNNCHIDKERERKFIRNFINKDKIERLEYELFSDKKRMLGILRLIPNIRNDLIFFHSSNIKDEDLLKIVSQIYNVNDDVYIISDNYLEDTTIKSFKVAFNLIMNSGNTYIVLCGEKIVFLKEEAHNSPSKLVLKLK